MLIDPVIAGIEPNVHFVRTPQVSYYRMGLPALPTQPAGSHAGKWHAVLQLGKTPDTTGAVVNAVRGRNPYSLIVHAYSNLRFRAWLTQSGYAPGSQLMLGATLFEYAVPVETRRRSGRT